MRVGMTKGEKAKVRRSLQRKFTHSTPFHMNRTGALLIAMMIFFFVISFAFYSDTMKLAHELQKGSELQAQNAELQAKNAERQSEKESQTNVTNQIVESVRRHMIIPDNSTIATIVDAEELKKKNSFYANTKNGDYLIVTPKRAILYDPDKDVIIDVISTQL